MSDDTTPSTTAIDQIYDKVNEVFGGTNKNQFFCMLMPTTVLNPKTYTYDTNGDKPALIKEAESKLANQLFDVCEVTGSSNGRQLSEQYLQALSVLVPRFDANMAIIKNELRNFLNSTPKYKSDDGTPFKGSLEELYFKLYQLWVDKEKEWQNTQHEQKNRFKLENPNNPEAALEAFVEWYETVAESHQAEVDAYMGKILTVFSPEDMDAILGALEAGPGGIIEEARRNITDSRLKSIDGGYIYPVEFSPSDWFIDLASDIDPVDLLDSPAYIALKLDSRRQALQACISQLQSLLSQQASSSTLVDLTNKLNAAQESYTTAQNNILKVYGANTALAVDIYLKSNEQQQQAASGKAEDKNKQIAEQITKNFDDLEKASGETGKSCPITPKDVDDILKGQKDLIDKQSALLTSCQSLADNGLQLSSAQVTMYKDLPSMLSRLKALCDDIGSISQQLTLSANKPESDTKPLFKKLDDTELQSIKTQIQNSAIQQCVDGVTIDKLTQTMDSTIKTLQVNDQNTAKDIVDQIVDKLQQYEKSPAGQSSKTKPDDYKQTISECINKYTQVMPNYTPKQSQGSDRYMDLQFCFSSDDMYSDSSLNSSFSQTSWSVDLFFGSASGSSTTSSSQNSKNYLDQSTSIEVGLKATKVEIQRNWFSPGLFLLSSTMDRMSSNTISAGPLNKSGWRDDALINSINNNQIFPCFPTSFVVAKDITIRFKATDSSLAAIKSLTDSKSAVGGGIFCFSVSHSSESHNESESLSTKAEEQVITITIKSPQILGWFLEFTPKDNSSVIDTKSDAFSIINYIKTLTNNNSNNTIAN